MHLEGYIVDRGERVVALAESFGLDHKRGIDRGARRGKSSAGGSRLGARF
jgi:hypothetical protein